MTRVTYLSRIGKKPIPIPVGVTITFGESTIIVKGPKGELALNLHTILRAEISDNTLSIMPKSETRKSAALWGLFRSLAANMVEGVLNGFTRKLEFEGIGYRVAVEGDGTLTFQLGFSHPVKFKAPDGIKLSVEKNVISVFGIDKERVGNVAAQIRKLKPPEPYKGKGIRYQGEVIRRKAGKKAVATST